MKGHGKCFLFLQCLMAEGNQKEQTPQDSHAVRTEVPPGVKLVRTFEGHQGPIFSLARDPQGGMLASGGGTVKLWEFTTGKLVRTLDCQQRIVRGLAFDPQGDMLASGGDDGTVKFWEVRSGKLLR